jgi:hypothetical protein
MPNFRSRVRSIFQISGLLAICVLAAVEMSFAGPCPTGPQATYQFVGTCTTQAGNCTGTGVGSLTVQNYTLGGTLTTCNLVSFTYTSNLANYTVTQANSPSLSGSLPSTLPGKAAILVQDSVHPTFQSNNDGTGSWAVGFDDFGTGGTWSSPTTTTSVPTLSTTALAALGLLLAGAGALLVRSRRSARA